MTQLHWQMSWHMECMQFGHSSWLLMNRGNQKHQLQACSTIPSAHHI